MSDSRPKKNTAEPAGPDRSGREIIGNGDNPAGGGNTAPNANREKRGKSWPVWALGALLLLVVIGLGWVFASQVLSVLKPVQTASLETDAQGDGPVSILPAEPAGVTVLEKQPDNETDNTLAMLAPVAQGADIATGFAMDLGSANSFLELSRRFAEISKLNGEDNFIRLEPRAVLRETVTGLEARLLVGPFETSDAARDACSVLILDEGMACEPATFEGELIARE